ELASVDDALPVDGRVGVAVQRQRPGHREPLEQVVPPVTVSRRDVGFSDVNHVERLERGADDVVGRAGDVWSPGCRAGPLDRPLLATPQRRGPTGPGRARDGHTTPLRRPSALELTRQGDGT